MFGAIPIDARPNEELDKTRAVLQRMTGVPAVSILGAAGESGLKPMMALPTMEECMDAVRRITGLDNLPPAETADRVEAEARARRLERVREMYSRPICDAADNSSDPTTIAVLIAERDSWKAKAAAAQRHECAAYNQLNAMRDRAEAAEAKLTTREASLHRATGARFNPPGSIGGP